MKHRNETLLFVLVFLFIALLPGCGRTPVNVILIMVDTLRADHLSCCGMEEIETPHIDTMAREGFLFTGLHSAAPTTLASTSSLMTSLYPRMHGAARNGFELDGSLLTIAEVLRGKGYTTAAFIASVALDSSTGIDQGFSTFDEHFTGTYDSPQLQRRAGEVNASVAAWLEKGPSQPFFLFVHYFDPHQPYEPPPPFDHASSGGGISPVTGSMDEVKRMRKFLAESGEVDERVRRLHELYLGEIRYTDSALGDLIRLLEEKGLYANSLVVFTADHGETFWEHLGRESIDHGYMVYETTAHIPLIIRWPGKVPPGKSDILASNIDIAPTVLDLAGIEIPGEFRGRSLAGALHGHDITPVPVYCEATKPYGKVERGSPFANDRKAKCIIMGSYKLLWIPYMSNLEELYDLTKDPREERNIIGEAEDTARVEDMRRALRSWSAEVSETARGRRIGVDEATRKKLEALGYVE